MELPELEFSKWENTCDTVHMWTQIVGKTRLALAPLENHWWNVPLYVTPRGLATSPIPYDHGTFDAVFDFIAHDLTLSTNKGREYVLPMYPRSVADFYGEYMSALGSLGVDIKINPRPAEFDDTTPFDEDRQHASYDREYVERFHRILVEADSILKEFRSRFIGKCSPVHFFWGSFDLAVTRFSGRRAPQQPTVDRITREAYSHEAISSGFWPGDRRLPHPAFYSYTAPAPNELASRTVQPKSAYWDTALGGEFILKYEDVRNSNSPKQTVLDFCQSTYEAGADLAHWDRQSLERQP